MFLTYYFVYLQTESIGHLLTAIGAFLTLLPNVFLAYAAVAVIVAALGKALFFLGIAVTATLGMSRERTVIPIIVE